MPTWKDTQSNHFTKTEKPSYRTVYIAGFHLCDRRQADRLMYIYRRGTFNFLILYSSKSFEILK